MVPERDDDEAEKANRTSNRRNQGKNKDDDDFAFDQLLSGKADAEEAKAMKPEEMVSDF